MIYLKPNKSRNTDSTNVFWVAEVEGPPGTIYERAMVLVELFVSPEYPFKGPTLSYEGHVVEFVTGKNQTDPREKNILAPWTPAMSLLDAALKVEGLLVEQQQKMEQEQLNLEKKRIEKKGIEEEVARRVEEQLAVERGVIGKQKEGRETGQEEESATAIERGKEGERGGHNPLRADGQKRRGGEGEEGEGGEEGGGETGVITTGSSPAPSAPSKNSATPVVRLSRSSAVPRRGSFRHSLTGKQGSAISTGLNLDELLGRDGDEAKE